jgi:hypothetical protein
MKQKSLVHYYYSLRTHLCALRISAQKNPTWIYRIDGSSHIFILSILSIHVKFLLGCGYAALRSLWTTKISEAKTSFSWFNYRYALTQQGG